MLSPLTGKPMIARSEPRTITFRKEDFTVMYHYYFDDETGEGFTDSQQGDLNLSQVWNQYRAKHHIPFPEEIISIRESYQLSAAKMSDILGFGINGWRLYEQGEVPSISNARLIRQAADSKSFFHMANDSNALNAKQLHGLLTRIEDLELILSARDPIESYWSEMQPSSLFGYRKPDPIRLAAMVQLLAKKSRPYKVKLNKLLFYADFTHFRTYGKSISGMPYVAIDMGPVPDRFASLFEWMERRRLILIHVKTFQNESIGEQFLPIEQSDLTAVLDSREMETLTTVSDVLGRLNSTRIIEFSHAEPAWLDNVSEKTQIDYSRYAFGMQEIKAL